MILTIRNFPHSREVNINYLIEREDNVNLLILYGSYRGTLLDNEMTYCHFCYAIYFVHLVNNFTRMRLVDLAALSPLE